MVRVGGKLRACPGRERIARSGRAAGIEELASGSLRVSVYVGIDPVSKRRHYLREVVPAGPKARAEAEKVMRRLANEVDERGNLEGAPDPAGC